MGWFIGIALASARHLPLAFLLPAFLFPIVGFFLWRHDRRVCLIWISVGFALAGAIRFTLRLPHFDQNSLSTHNGIGVVTLEGVIDADPDVRDTYINLRVKADRSSRPAKFRYGDRVGVTDPLTAPPSLDPSY
ncbi:hypothetical protein TFLX_00470 [Thermoflexales bacterium]|nr:hypothetical protein TFLX_00470 [Thermoflexales bacterium]